jgi:ADP-heptose:LPS heptosyltransferase
MQKYKNCLHSNLIALFRPSLVTGTDTFLIYLNKSLDIYVIFIFIPSFFQQLTPKQLPLHLLIHPLASQNSTLILYNS